RLKKHQLKNSCRYPVLPHQRWRGCHTLACPRIPLDVQPQARVSRFAACVLLPVRNLLGVKRCAVSLLVGVRNLPALPVR
ncbi:TPA: hypothetical protein ACGE6K_004928, partial [Serratia marcescens]